MERRHDWVIVASVRGERARPYFGDGERPCSAEQSGFAHALQRASQIASPSRITPVVLDEHRPWWAPLLSNVPKQNLVVEPFDRGTAAGILLASVRLLRRDPKATVAIISADTDPAIDVVSAYGRALELAQAEDACAGVTRDGTVDLISWLPPSEVEMIAGSIQHVIALFQTTQPKLLQTYLKELHGPALFSDDALDTIYPFLPEVPFTAGVLETVHPGALATPLAETRTTAV